MFPAVAFVRSKRIFLATKATIKRHCRLPEKESSKETEGKKGSRLRFPIWQHFMEGHILQLYDRTRVNRWNYHPAKVRLGEIFFFLQRSFLQVISGECRSIEAVDHFGLFCSSLPVVISSGASCPSFQADHLQL